MKMNNLINEYCTDTFSLLKNFKGIAKFKGKKIINPASDVHSKLFKLILFSGKYCVSSRVSELSGPWLLQQ
jgi:hypothetical protein